MVEIYSLSRFVIFSTLTEELKCQGRTGEIQDSILQNGYLDMLKLEVENNTQDVPIKSSKHLGNNIDIIAMAFNSPILDLPHLCTYINFLNMIPLTYPAFICAEALSVISLDSGDVEIGYGLKEIDSALRAAEER